MTVKKVCYRFGVSERRACKVLTQARATQRYRIKLPDDEGKLTEAIINLASQYGRYGYRRVTALLRNEGWLVNHKRVERIWRQEGLKVPGKQPKRGRLWLNDGSCVRLRAEHRDHVWSYDFVHNRTADGRPIRILTLIDEYTRECLSLSVARKLNSHNVLDELSCLFLTRGIPKHIRSDNGPEFTAKAVREWLELVGVNTLFIEPGSPWENGYIESFNGKLRDELLNGEIFTTLFEAKVLIEDWRQHCYIPTLLHIQIWTPNLYNINYFHSLFLFPLLAPYIVILIQYGHFLIIDPYPQNFLSLFQPFYPP